MVTIMEKKFSYVISKKNNAPMLSQIQRYSKKCVEQKKICFQVSKKYKINRIRYTTNISRKQMAEARGKSRESERTVKII